MSTVGLWIAAPLVFSALIGRLIHWRRRNALLALLEEASEPLSLQRRGRGFVGTSGGVALGLSLAGTDLPELVLAGPRSALRPGLQIQAGHARQPTGDPLFDQEIVLSGLEHAELLALAEPDLRRALVPAVQAGLSFREGRWSARLSHRQAAPERVLEVARALASAHTALERAARREVRQALLERLADPNAGVRRHALSLALSKGWAEASALAPLLQDLDPEVRLGAATALGRWAILLEMVRTASRTWKMRAARVLVQRRAPLREEDRALLEGTALSMLPDPELSEDAAELLIAVGSPRALPALEELARTGSRPARLAADQARAAIAARQAAQAGPLSLER